MELAREAAQAAEDKKGLDVLILDITQISTVADYFVLSTGNSSTQVKAIADHVEEKLTEAGIKPLRREGVREGRWILLDYGDVVVHVFQQEDRAYYNLERLWGDAQVVNYE
ncbi:MAG: ribosome silencing factor [Clostridia bacterium]|nr:ribosome silencing factor [Clostridia bacterium]